MSAILWILAAVLVAGGALVALRSNRTKARHRKALPAPRQPTLASLAVNDVVTHFDRDYLVEGAVRYQEAGERWSASRMTDGDSESWLYVWGDPAERIALLTDGDVRALPDPPPQNVTLVTQAPTRIEVETVPFEQVGPWRVARGSAQPLRGLLGGLVSAVVLLGIVTAILVLRLRRRQADVP